jgi:hypothetical protein
MDLLKAAVIEWRDARRAFFDVAPISMDPKERFPQAIWIRLGNAEDRLMKMATELAAASQ